MHHEEGLLQKRRFDESSIFDYNSKLNFFRGLFIILSLGAVFVLTILFILFLRDSDFFIFTIIKAVFSHISYQIKTGSIAGLFYTTFFGGFFFVFMPLEIIFIGFLNKGINPFLLFSIYLLGYAVSFSFNYFFGAKLSEISKKAISLKKFYWIKGLLNKYGAKTIFVFNLFPLPSQPLSALLGVFKYNKARFYFYFLLGQGMKYLAIILFIIFALK